VFAYQGIKDMLTAHGFAVERMAGAGYFPIPGRPGNLLGWLDPWHAAFILAKGRVPRN